MKTGCGHTQDKRGRSGSGWGWLAGLVIWGAGVCCTARGSVELLVMSPTNGMLVCGSVVMCTGTSANAAVLMWTNAWRGGGASGNVDAGPVWWCEVPCGHGTNELTVVAQGSEGGAATGSVKFLADQSVIVITSQDTNFATNMVTFTIFGTGAYLKNIMWWNYYSSSNATGMIGGTNDWMIDIIGAAQGSNHFTVWGFSHLGILSQDARWYWVDGVAPVVTELEPADGTNVAPPHVRMSWSVSEDAACTVFTNNARAGSGTDQLTLSNLQAGVYYWFVRAEDSVGNVGYSATNHFIVPEAGAVWAAILFTIYDIRFTICRRSKR